MQTKLRRHWKAVTALTVLLLAAAGFAGATARGAAQSNEIHFNMVRSTAATNAGCLAGASALVTVASKGPTETMTVRASHLPANTEFDFFVIQVPNAPFGLSWYQGDIETGDGGSGTGVFIGRFSIETFIVSPGSAPAPVVHNNAFPDASQNVPFNPTHTFHLGLWFNDPADAAKAGCPANVTPFNGDHDAGIQALSTKNFPDLQGPLGQLIS